MSATLLRHPDGITWHEAGAMARAAHALADDGRVWLIDPFADDAALAAAAELGQPAGVIQLLDRHGRDGVAIARDLGVPLLQMPDAVPGSPFTVVPVLSWPRWREIALWWPATRTLVVSEAIGTAPLFALGRRAGVHPLLRFAPPRGALGGHGAERLLVGHGAPVLADGQGAIDAALSHARRDIPRLALRLPGALRGG